MKNIIYAVFFLLFGIGTAPNTYSQGAESVVSPFLPEIVTGFPGVRDITFSPDEKELYFTIQSYLGEVSAIAFCNNVNGKWSEPEVASFSGRFHDPEPFFAPNGLRLFFVSDLPGTKGETDASNYDIWVVERSSMQNAWSQPVNLGSPVNTAGNIFYPVITESGNLYFTGDGPLSNGKDDIFVSRFANGKYTDPVSVGDSVNSIGYEFNAFVAPDETYMLFTCYNREGGFGSGDLYLSHNVGKGVRTRNWSAPVNLGKGINSPQRDYCP